MSYDRKSKYVLVVDNLSSYTRSHDLKKEFSYFGPILAVERDARHRVALCEYKYADDAEEAWRKMDGFNIDGRRLKVDWATRRDFDFFGWKWTESSRSPSRSRSRSRDKRSRSQSPIRSQDERAGSF